MTPEQQQWADSMRASLSGDAVRAPREPTNALRGACFRLVRSQPFDYGVMGVIVANVFAMACEFEGIEEHAEYSWRLTPSALGASIRSFLVRWFLLCLPLGTPQSS